jgi:hypothetical protein
MLSYGYSEGGHDGSWMETLTEWCGEETSRKSEVARVECRMRSVSDGDLVFVLFFEFGVLLDARCQIPAR